MANFDENVVILHGLAINSRYMAKLARYLAAQGYKVHNLDYPSLRHGLEKLCELIHGQIKQKIPPTEKIHFVGFSLGGLLIRILLSHPEYRPINLGRVVQLGAPNLGSTMADFLQHNWFYKKIFGSAGQELITDQTKLNHLFQPVNYELGVIAGTRALGPISAWFMKGPSDGLVSVENTKVMGMKEHLLVNLSHIFLPLNNKVLELTARFLKTGSFNII